MLAERNNGVIILEVKEDDSVKFIPHKIKDEKSDNLSNLVIQEIPKLKEREKKFKCPINEVNGHGQRRSEAKIRRIQDYRKRELPRIITKLEILEGNLIKPIRIQEEQIGDKKFKSIRVSEFTTKEEREWWEFVKESGNLNEVAELANVFPEGFDYLREFFNIRRRVSTSLTVLDETEINKDWSISNDKLRNMNDESVDKLLPLRNKIDSYFRIPIWYKRPR